MPSFFIRAKRGTQPFANNKVLAIKAATEIYYFNSGRAITARGGFFDEPIGSACEVPQGGYRKPPARPVVMTFKIIFEIIFLKPIDKSASLWYNIILNF